MSLAEHLYAWRERAAKTWRSLVWSARRPCHEVGYVSFEEPLRYSGRRWPDETFSERSLNAPHPFLVESVEVRPGPRRASKLSVTLRPQARSAEDVRRAGEEAEVRWRLAMWSRPTWRGQSMFSGAQAPENGRIRA